LDSLPFFPSFPEIDTEADKDQNEDTSADAKEEVAEGFELIAVQEGLAGLQDFEVAIIGGSKFFAAGQVIADSLKGHAQVICVVDQKKPRVGGVGKTREIVSLDLAQP
jgi:hypothetical protein